MKIKFKKPTIKVKLPRVSKPDFSSLSKQAREVKFKRPSFKFDYKQLSISNLKAAAARNKKAFYTNLIVLVLVLLYIIGAIIVSISVYSYNNHSNLIRKFLYIYPLPAAVVDYHPILVSTVYQQIGYVEKYTTQSCQADSKSCQEMNAYSSIRDRALEQQIQNVIVGREANKFNIRVSKTDVDKAYQQVIGQNGGDKEVSKVLSSLYGMSIPQFKDLLRAQLLKDKIDQKEIQRVDVSHILMDDQDKAKSVLADISASKISFSDAAKQYSQDSNSKDKGGSLGTIARGIMPAEFDDIAFSKAKVGQVYSEPVKTGFGYHIILVNKRTGTIKQSFQDWLNSLEKKAKVIKFLK